MTEKILVLKDKDKRNVLVAAILAVLSPLIMCAVQAWFAGGNLGDVMPTWNDEGGYYRQLNAMISYGHPLGYNGYNGSHASIGNFGFHGYFVLLPYYLFSLLFGLEYNTIFLCNIFLVSLSIAIFIFILKPSAEKMLIVCAGIYTPMVSFYLATNMIEGLNYFFAIIFAVLFLKISEDPLKRWLIISWLTLIFAVLCKITWICFAFPLAMYTFKKTKKYIRVILSAGVMLAGLAAGYFVFSLFSAPYFTSQIDVYKEAVKNGESTVRILQYILQNLKATLLATCFSGYKAWFSVTAVFFWVVLVASAVVAVKNYKGKKAPVLYIPFYIMCAFSGGILLMYTGGAVAFRTICPAVVFCVVLLLYKQIGRISKWVSAAVIVSTLVCGMAGGYDNRLFQTKDMAENIYKIKEFNSVIQINEKSGPLDNTVMVYIGNAPSFYYTMLYPAGTGNNAYNYIPDKLGEEYPKYVLLAKKDAWYQKLMESGYSVINENEEAILMKSR